MEVKVSPKQTHCDRYQRWLIFCQRRLYTVPKQFNKMSYVCSGPSNFLQQLRFIIISRGGQFTYFFTLRTSQFSFTVTSALRNHSTGMLRRGFRSHFYGSPCFKTFVNLNKFNGFTMYEHTLYYYKRVGLEYPFYDYFFKCPIT